MRRSLAAILIALVAAALAVAILRKSSAGAATPPPDHGVVSIEVGGWQRRSLVYVPPGYDGKTPVALVLMLHGMGGEAAIAAKDTGWSAKAKRETFIVAYPEATRPDAEKTPSLSRNPPAWNDGSGRFHAGERNIDDVAFIRALIDRVSAGHRIDPRRVFVAGFSNGASMAFRIAAELPHRIAAIAPVAGSCWTENLPPMGGVSVCCITGTADPLNPLEGGYPRLAIGGADQGGRPKPPVRVTIEKWRRALACPEAPAQEESANGVHVRRHGPGRDGAAIEFITVEGLGHVWPGGNAPAPALLVGRTNDRLNATDTAWEFFRSHPASPDKR